jgi:hypothetical protein
MQSATIIARVVIMVFAVTKVTLDIATGFVLGAIPYPFRARGHGAFRNWSEHQLAG